MPRQPRLDIPGALHHITVRGINKTDIFRDDQDRVKFLKRLGENVIETKSSVYAWVLMDNLNPIRSGIVKDIEALNNYPWSGHSAVMGKSKCQWMDTEYILAQFGTKKKAAVNAYRRFMEKGLNIKYGSDRGSHVHSHTCNCSV